MHDMRGERARVRHSVYYYAKNIAIIEFATVLSYRLFFMMDKI